MTGGYQMGPVLDVGESPFFIGWESDPRVDDGHAHEWELVTVQHSEFDKVEVAVRCRVCLCPRCGHSVDEDPCMERRHHDSVHITLEGRFEPVGGYLRPLPEETP